MFLSDTVIQPGDTVTVKRAGIVYVLGAVTRPGGYIMQEGGELDVTQAVCPGLRNDHARRNRIHAA